MDKSEKDHAFWGDLFQCYYNDLYYYGLKIVPLPDLVKDAIQDVFILVWDRRKKLINDNLKSYLLISLKRDLLRKISVTPLPQDISAQNEFTFSIEDFLIQQEENEEVNLKLINCLKKLSPRQREVIFLKFSQNLGFQQLAEVMEMNIQSVRNLLFRALEKIKSELKDDYFDSIEDINLLLFSLFMKNRKINFE